MFKFVALSFLVTFLMKNYAMMTMQNVGLTLEVFQMKEKNLSTLSV